MAEVVLQERIASAGLTELVVVDSAGTGDWHIGYPADERARGTLARHGYLDEPESSQHQARQINFTWMAELDLILAMDIKNYVDIEKMIQQSGYEPELTMLRSFDPELSQLEVPHPELDVPDPYYGSGDGFTDVLKMIERATDGLISQLPARLNR
jgi:protein-tyrosine phosphatase